MLDPNGKGPERRLGNRFLVSAILVLASAAYVYWQDFAQLSGAEVKKGQRSHVYRTKLASARLPVLGPAPAAPAPSAMPSIPPSPSTLPSTASTATTAAASATIAAAQSLPRRTFADGDYIGDPADAEWGNVQVKVTIRDGAIVDVQFLQTPDHRSRSAEISEWATLILTSEAIREQNYDVDIVSSATFTSLAFQQALYSALLQAKK